MFTDLLKRFLKKTAFMAMCTGFMLVITTGTVQAAANCSISTVPANATINEGQTIDFSGSVTGKGKKTCDWTFEGGVPDFTLDDCSNIVVSYAIAGSYDAVLTGTASKDGTCTDTVTVTVNLGGGNNTPPIAVDDPNYSTTVDTQLVVIAPGVVGNDTDADNDTVSVDASSTGTGSTSQGGTVTLNINGSFTYDPPVGFTGADTFTYFAYDGTDSSNAPATVTITVNGGGVNTPPIANPDSYNATTGVELSVGAPGVLGNDTDDGLIDPLVVSNLVSDVSNGTLDLLDDGSFTYTGNSAGTDSFTYEASDGEFVSEATVTITVSDALPPIDPELNPQTDFKIMMNYELGMHCTGFEFAYCCVLPAYNSILAQVVKPNTIDPNHSGDYARLMAGDPREGLDGLGRETVVRDMELDNSGNFKKYVLKYWHEAQPRNDGRGKPQSSLLISAAEGNSLLAWNTVFDSAAVVDGAMQYGTYNGSQAVLQGDGDFTDPTDNYQNAVWNHLYFYENLEGDNSSGTSLEADKIRLGVAGQPGPFPAVAYPTDCGPAFHPLGPQSVG